MDRRTFSKTLLGLITASALPGPLHARAPIGNQGAFLKALAEKPWLLGYLGAQNIELKANIRIVSGKLPDDLRGHFYRNGPALHNIGPDRFSHWFDAPGMIQKFTFANNTVSHHGRLIETARNAGEARAGTILFSAFGTYGDNLSSGGSADGQNTGNISLVYHADDLLALWEGGSAHIIDPQSLKTEGRKDWSAQTRGLPFGAHPRKDRDGSLWNIGYSANPAALILYHIAADGRLLRTHILAQISTPMVHDFMITETKIVIVAPPYSATNMAGKTFGSLFEWDATQPTEILVIDKNDPADMSRIEIDPFWVFHFGNAYDISATEIGFDLALHDTPGFMTHDAFAAMDGSWDGKASATSHYVQARVGLDSKTARLTKAPQFGQVEFIQTDWRDDLAHHRHALMLAHSSKEQDFHFNRLLLIDRLSENHSYFDVGKTEILEEHLIVPKPGRKDAFWIMGTALDWQKGVTTLSVYDGAHLPDGPIMKAELDLALPLGLHGLFRQV